MYDEHNLTLRQADQARADFAALADDLDFIKAQIARRPSRAYVSRLALLASASVWALMAALVLMPVR